MKIIYYLKTCDTCRRIMQELRIDEEWERREIKSQPVSESELENMRKLAGNYEALFSRRSRQYRARELHLKNLSEADYKSLILEEYTFLNRPVIIIDDSIFIGNSKKNVEKVREYLNSL
jgi:arsenate reductase